MAVARLYFTVRDRTEVGLLFNRDNPVPCIGEGKGKGRVRQRRGLLRIICEVWTESRGDLAARVKTYPWMWVNSMCLQRTEHTCASASKSLWHTQKCSLGSPCYPTGDIWLSVSLWWPFYLRQDLRSRLRYKQLRYKLLFQTWPVGKVKQICKWALWGESICLPLKTHQLWSAKRQVK